MDQAARVILEQLPTLTHRGIVVDSPPGAGKSTLVARAADALAQSSVPCVVIAQTNSQVDHLVRRFARHHPHLRTARLTATDHTVPYDLQAHPGIRISTRIEALEKTADVIVGTAMKWATVTDRRWPWAIIDEAYQMRSDMLLWTAGLFDRALFVGDPGQLAPFSAVKTDRFHGLPHDPAGFQVEGGGVAAAGEGVQDDGDAEFAALESVGGVDGDPVQLGIVAGQESADVVGLAAVSGADGDVIRQQDVAFGSFFAGGDGAPGQQPLGDAEGGVEGFEVVLAGDAGW
ncbi:AAA family ATPase [Streptomyces pseudogriseolus]|uniref:AAA family ATPase n=1 Tax=Streptomyces pseudogriseolus TaxID=36817 RepID=UPI003FA22108